MSARNTPEDVLRLVDRSGGPDACWPWIGRLNPYGYGSSSLVLASGRHERGAHRIVYSLLVGPIPEGLQLDHLCRNPRCVNPAHLEPVTMVENLLRGVNPPAVNARMVTCQRGHPFDGIHHRYGRPFRYCKTCARTRQAGYNAARREAINARRRDLAALKRERRNGLARDLTAVA